jgi:multidrug resistance efflux pump
MSSESVTEASPAQMPEDAGVVSYAILDQALWHKFRNAAGPEEFIETWLAIMCRQIRGAVAGLVVLGEPDVGPFTPVAYWPGKDEVGPALSAAAEKAIEQRQGVVVSSSKAGAPQERQLACPLVIDEHLYGVCAVSLGASNLAANEVMRKLQWAAGWIEVLLRRQMQGEFQGVRERSVLAFDMLATVLENKTFVAASTALVTELSMRLQCDPVAIGFVRRRRCVVAAMSHSAVFGKKLSFMRDIAAAMDEAVDQSAIVLYPADDTWEYRVTRAHEELAQQHKAGGVLTIPLQSNRMIVGAITLQKPPGECFDETVVDLCDGVAAVVGPVLEEKRRNDRNILSKNLISIATQLQRLFGPRYFGRKLATVIVAALVAYFSVATTQHTVTSPAVIEGTVQRTIVAPFNGYVAIQNARAGEVVSAGELIARLDDQDLILERLRLATSRQQKLVEYDRALAKHERAEAIIIKTQIDQADVQLALIDEQVARTRITAPFDGYVVDGDLSQSIGAAVERGQELFKIAPLDAYRVALEVDETDVNDIEVGQTGMLRVASLPDETMNYRIERITAISHQEDGRNFFRAEAALDSSTQRLRPGMEGIAKTLIDERLLIRSYTEKLVDWVRLALWRWLP